jgi:hypothetical protein
MSEGIPRCPRSGASFGDLAHLRISSGQVRYAKPRTCGVKKVQSYSEGEFLISFPYTHFRDEKDVLVYETDQ